MFPHKKKQVFTFVEQTVIEKKAREHRIYNSTNIQHSIVLYTKGKNNTASQLDPNLDEPERSDLVSS